MNATVINPMLRDHCHALAERYLADTRPAAGPSPRTTLVRCGPRAWFVVQTVLHGEDKVAEALSELGFETYAPMMRKEVKNKRSRRTTMRTLRMFNRYVFGHLPVDKQEWRTLRAIEEIKSILGEGGGYPVADEEILRFRRAEAARAFDVTKAVTFPVGSRVRVTQGPFGGFSALVESLPGRAVIKAMIDLFGRATPVELPFDWVAPA